MRTFFRYTISCTNQRNNRKERYNLIAESEDKAIQKAFYHGYVNIDKVEPLKYVYVVVRFDDDVAICKNEQELFDLLSSKFKDDPETAKYHCEKGKLEDYFLCESVYYLSHEAHRVEFSIK